MKGPRCSKHRSPTTCEPAEPIASLYDSIFIQARGLRKLQYTHSPRSPRGHKNMKMKQKYSISDERFLRLHPQLFEKTILIAAIKSFRFYANMRSRLCPLQEMQKSRRLDFHKLNHNKIYGLIADYWNQWNDHLDCSQDYSIKLPDLEELLRSEMNNGRIAQADAQALFEDLKEDMELFEFSPEVLESLHLDPLINTWLDRRAATNIIEFAHNNRMLKFPSLAELRTQIEAAEASLNLREFVDAWGYIQKPLEKPVEVVAGLLRQGCRMSVSGGSKTFKSWMLLDLAVAVAYGGKWLNFATTPGRVLFLNLELPEWAICERIHAIACAKGGEGKSDQLFVQNLRGGKTPFAQNLPGIIAKAKAINASLVIVDPTYKMKRDVDENSTADAADLLGLIEKLSAETNAAVTYGQHFSKGNQALKESIDRISGSGVFARDPDSILTFTSHKEPFSYTCEATLRTEAPLDPFVVQWKFPLMVRNYTLKADDLKRVGGRTARHEPGALLDFLPAHGIKPGDWEKIAAAKLGIGETTFKDLRRKLSEAGLIHKDPASGLWLPSNSKNKIEG